MTRRDEKEGREGGSRRKDERRDVKEGREGGTGMRDGSE